jgi:tRNA dimethylallyltransferase
MITLNYDMITVLGATAGGKTGLATELAYQLNGEVISADSRQVYKGMDIGTGKDLQEYSINNKLIPYHLIDIVDAGYKYNVYEYQKDFLKVYEDIKSRNKFPVLCGGTGMYIEAVLKGYKLTHVPIDEKIRSKLQNKTNEELIQLLKNQKKLHNSTDTDNRKRLVRAIEIALHNEKYPELDIRFPKINSFIIQVIYDRNQRRKRISERLKHRLKNGMIEEVEKLINDGVNTDVLKYYGLEYKFITEYLLNELSQREMEEKLEIAIHQFSKRQMTWFRKMEKDGFVIYKIDGNLSMEKKISSIFMQLNINQS